MPQNLPFDTHQRLHLLKRLIEHVVRDHTTESPAWILDVGGYPGILASELNHHRRVITVDRKPCAISDYLRASGMNLPFADQSMNAVVASDMLEHVSSDRREELIAEICRVANGWILINGPCRFPETEQAEASVNDLVRSITGGPDPWLEEHWQNGLPDLSDTRRMLEKQEFTTIVVPNGSLFSWFLLKSLDLLFRVLPDATTQYEQINDLYVRLWSDIDHRRPTYRHLILAHRDPEQLLSLIQEPPAKTGMEFFGPRTDVPLAKPEEAQRIRSAGAFLERFAAYLREQLASGVTQSLDSNYLNRLEKIVEEQEQQQARMEMEIADLRARLAVYETSRFVKLWRKLRWR